MDVEKLRESLKAIVLDPALAPAAGKTFCNFAVFRAAKLLGCDVFRLDANNDPPLANDMTRILAACAEFVVVDGCAAAQAALEGRLVIACHAYAGHGHVAAVYPSPEMFYSPSLKKEVPFLATTGSADVKAGILPASEVFAVADGEPLYYRFTK